MLWVYPQFSHRLMPWTWPQTIHFRLGFSDFELIFHPTIGCYLGKRNPPYCRHHSFSKSTVIRCGQERMISLYISIITCLHTYHIISCQVRSEHPSRTIAPPCLKKAPQVVEEMMCDPNKLLLKNRQSPHSFLFASFSFIKKMNPFK